MNIMCTLHTLTHTHTMPHDRATSEESERPNTPCVCVCAHCLCTPKTPTLLWLWQTSALALALDVKTSASIVCFVFLFVLLFAFWISCINFFFHRVALIRCPTPCAEVDLISFSFFSLSDCFIHSFIHSLSHVPLCSFCVVVVIYSLWHFHFVAARHWNSVGSAVWWQLAQDVIQNLFRLHSGNNIYAWTIGQPRLPLPYVLR